MSRKICIVTSSRADYGLLYYLLREIEQSDDFELCLAVTGTHLSPEFGRTISEIERDGFKIAGRIEMLISSDSAAGIAKSIGLGFLGFADFYEQEKPELVMLLGDRFEMLAAAGSALVAKLPIAHLCGGDLTEGAYDDAIRHSLTKMSHLHFVTNEEARERVIQMGEQPDNVFLAGSTGLDFIRNFDAIDRASLANDLGLDAELPWLLITFHPVTLGDQPSIAQLKELLAALDHFASKYSLIVTQPNADNDGRALSAFSTEWAESRDNAHFFKSLGQKRYLSVMKNAVAVIGNSSSGLYETPSFGIPTVNIGTRQSGRLKASSVIDCSPIESQIVAAIEEAVSADYVGAVNPYGDGNSSKRIVHEISAIKNFRDLVHKKFYDVDHIND